MQVLHGDLKSGNGKKLRAVADLIEPTFLGGLRRAPDELSAVRGSRGSTRSPPTGPRGKILRGTMKKIADGEPYTATIDNPPILEENRRGVEGVWVG